MDKIREEGRLEKKQAVFARTDECIEREGEGGETQPFSQLPCRLNKMSSAPSSKWSQFAPASNKAASQLAEALAPAMRMHFITAALVKNNNSIKNLLNLCSEQKTHAEEKLLNDKASVISQRSSANQRQPSGRTEEEK